MEAGSLERSPLMLEKHVGLQLSLQCKDGKRIRILHLLELRDFSVLSPGILHCAIFLRPP